MVQSILVGTDGSATASIAVTQAIDLARAVGARLQIVSAYEPVTAGPLGIGRLHAAGEVQWPVPPRARAGRRNLREKLWAGFSHGRLAGHDREVYGP